MDDQSLSNLTVVGNFDAVPAEVSRKKLLRLTKGQLTRWENGKRIKLALVNPKLAKGATTVQALCGITGDEFRKYWISMNNQGRALPPEFFESEKDLINYVSTTVGAIGIISSGENLMNDDIFEVEIVSSN